MVNIKNGWTSAVRELDEKIEDSGSEAPTVDTLSGATAVGKDVMKAADAAAARTAIGAGTSNLVIGTGATQAKAGNYAPPVVTGSVNGLMLSADKTKLDGIAANSTANSTDAELRARANHTGTQAISTVAGLQAALDALSARLDALETPTGG